MAEPRGPRGNRAGGRPGDPPPRHQSTRMMPLPGREPAGPPPRRRPPAGPPPTRAMHQPPSGPPPAPPRRPRQPQPPMRPPRGRGVRPGTVVKSLLMVIFLLLAGIWLYLEFAINRVEAIEDYAGRPAEAEGTNWLIVGSDSRKGLTKAEQKKLHTGHNEGNRTDTILLAHLPDNDTKPTLVSFPRDLNVEIPGQGVNKINAAYSSGGPKLLVKTVEHATDLHIDHYAEIGFGGFANIVDAIGGVEMKIEQDMVDQKSGAKLKKGVQELDGAQALAFVRSRYGSATPRSDLDRVDNQRKFIGALANEIASPATLLNPFDVVPLLAEAPDALSIDEGDHLHNLVGLAWAMRGISSGGMVNTTVPLASGAANSFNQAKAEQMFDALRTDKALPDSLINSVG